MVDAEPPVPDAAEIVGLLADDDRRRVVAALVLGATTVDEVKAATGLPGRVVGSALLACLVAGELVERAPDGTHLLLGEAFRRAAVAVANTGPPPDPTGDASPDAAKVLRTFFRGGRLTSIPSSHAKRLIILDRLAQELDPGVRYSERQVNALLRPFHEDVAALRRYLVDDGFLDRDAGRYWRTGGSVDLR